MYEKTPWVKEVSSFHSPLPVRSSKMRSHRLKTLISNPFDKCSVPRPLTLVLRKLEAELAVSGPIDRAHGRLTVLGAFVDVVEARDVFAN